MRRAYKILNIKHGATFEEVKQAYKKQAMEWHPDRFPADDEELQKKPLKISIESPKPTNSWKPGTPIKRRGSTTSTNPITPLPTGTGERPTKTGWTMSRGIFRSSSPAPGKNGDKYEGMAISERMHGQGIFTFANGSVYTGQFKYGNMDGLGKFVFSNGDVYSGGFRENQFHGQGKMDFASGDRYTGNFAKDQYHGEGVFVSARGTVHAGMWDYGSLLSEPEPPFNRY